jgi:hypothetical protein
MRHNGGVIAVAFVKWVVVPVGLAAIGFFVVGPRVANSYLTPDDSAGKPTVVEPIEEKSRKSSGEPKVEVTAQRVKQSSHRRPKPKPVVDPEVTSPETGPPSDESPEPPTPNDNGGANSDGAH